MELLGPLTPYLFTLVLLVVGGLVGRARERRHLSELDEREAALAHIMVVDLPSDPTRDRADILGREQVA